jgi:peptide deformylase
MAQKANKHFVSPSDPILIKKAKEIPVGRIRSVEIQNIIEKMLDIAFGEQGDRKRPILVGLAAPQVGISKRIIFVDVAADGHGGVGNLRIYINPKIIWKAKESEEWYEGCFSTNRVCGIVKRPKSVEIEAYTREGKLIKEKHQGYSARIFQHEIDHLDGQEFVSHIKDDNKLHWVEDYEFPKYRDKEAWRTWPKKCPREKWERIKKPRKLGRGIRLEAKWQSSKD